MSQIDTNNPLEEQEPTVPVEPASPIDNQPGLPEPGDPTRDDTFIRPSPQPPSPPGYPDTGTANDWQTATNAALDWAWGNSPRPRPRANRSVVGGTLAAVGRTGTNMASGVFRLPSVVVNSVTDLRNAIDDPIRQFEAAGIAGEAVNVLSRVASRGEAGAPVGTFFNTTLTAAKLRSAVASLQGEEAEAVKPIIDNLDRLQVEMDERLGRPPEPFDPTNPDISLSQWTETNKRRARARARILKAEAWTSFPDTIADWLAGLADSDLLYQSPDVARARALDMPIYQQMQNPRWWNEVLPEYVTSAATVFVPTLTAAKVLSATGRAAAGARVAQFGGGTLAFGMEAGTAYEEMRADLMATGHFTEEEAGILASHPALGYGVASAMVEATPWQLSQMPRVRSWLVRTAVAGGLEGTEEAFQTVLQGVARGSIGLDPEITANRIAEGFLGGFVGGAALSPLIAPNLPPPTFEERARAWDPELRRLNIHITEGNIEFLTEDDTLNPAERERWLEREVADLEIMYRLDAEEPVDGPTTPGQRSDHLGANVERQAAIAVEERPVEDVDIEHRANGHIGDLLESPVQIADIGKRKDLKAAVQIGRRLGHNVVVMKPMIRKDGGTITGWIDPDNRRLMVISEDLEGEAAFRVVAHEFLHGLEHTPAWEDFNAFVNDYDPEGLRQAARKYYDDLGIYGRTGESFAQWAVSRHGQTEALAQYFQEHVLDTGMYSALADNPSLFQRLKDLWRRLMVRLGSYGIGDELHAQRAQEMTRLLKAEPLPETTRAWFTTDITPDQVDADPDAEVTGEAAPLGDAVAVIVRDVEGRVLSDETFANWEAAKDAANTANQVEGQEVELRFPIGGGAMLLKPGKQYSGEPGESAAGPPRREQIISEGAGLILQNIGMDYSLWVQRMAHKYPEEMNNIETARSIYRRSMHAAQQYLRSQADLDARDRKRNKRSKLSRKLANEERIANRAARAQKRETEIVERAKARALVEQAIDRAEHKLRNWKKLRDQLDAASDHLPSEINIRALVRNVKGEASLRNAIQEINYRYKQHYLGVEKKRLRQTVADIDWNVDTPYQRPLTELLGGKKKFRDKDRLNIRGMLAHMGSVLEPPVVDVFTEKLGGAHGKQVSVRIKPVDQKKASKQEARQASEDASLSIQEMRDLSNAIRHLQFEAKEANSERLLDDKIQKTEAYNGVATELDLRQEDRGRDAFNDLKPDDRGFFGALVRTFRFALFPEGYAKPERYARFISPKDGTAINEIWFEALDEADHRVQERHYQFEDQLKSILESEGFAWGSTALQRMSRFVEDKHGWLMELVKYGDLDFRQPIRGTVKAEQRVVELSDGQKLIASPAELMGFYATVQDANNVRQILVNGAGVRFGSRGDLVLTAEDIDKLTNSLSPKERAVADKMVEVINLEGSELLSQWSRQNLGYDITQEGTYWPRKRVRQASDTDVEPTADYGNQRQLENTSITHDRVDSDRSLHIADIFETYANHTWLVTNLALRQPTLKTAINTLKSDQVQAVLEKKKAGRRINRYYDRWFDAITRHSMGGQVKRGAVDETVRFLSMQITKGSLAFHPVVTLYQVTSLIQASTEIPKRFLFGNIAALLPSKKIDDEMRRWAPRIRTRIDSTTIGLFNEFIETQRSRLGHKQSGDKLMAPIAWMDQAAVRTIWAASKDFIRHSRPELDQNTPEYWDAVRRKAERVIFRTQPVFDVMHQSGVGIEAQTNSFVKSMTLFYSQRNQNMNMLLDAYMRVTQGRQGIAKTGEDVAKVLIGAPLVITSIQLIRDSLLKGGDGELDDEEFKALTAAFTNNIVSNFYLAGIFTPSIQKILDPENRAFDRQVSPVLSNVESLWDALDKVIGGVDDSDEMISGAFDFLLVAGTLSGHQLAPIARMARTYYRGKTGYYDDRDFSTSVGLGGRGLTGVPRLSR